MRNQHVIPPQRRLLFLTVRRLGQHFSFPPPPLVILMSTKCMQPPRSLCHTHKKSKTSPGESPWSNLFVECNCDIKELHPQRGKGHVRVKCFRQPGKQKSPPGYAMIVA